MAGWPAKPKRLPTDEWGVRLRPDPDGRDPYDRRRVAPAERAGVPAVGERVTCSVTTSTGRRWIADYEVVATGCDDGGKWADAAEPTLGYDGGERMAELRAYYRLPRDQWPTAWWAQLRRDAEGREPPPLKRARWPLVAGTAAAAASDDADGWRARRDLN